jgi:hypothetical protein
MNQAKLGKQIARQTNIGKAVKRAGENPGETEQEGKEQLDFNRSVCGAKGIRGTTCHKQANE